MVCPNACCFFVSVDEWNAPPVHICMFSHSVRVYVIPRSNIWEKNPLFTWNFYVRFRDRVQRVADFVEVCCTRNVESWTRNAFLEIAKLARFWMNSDPTPNSKHWFTASFLQPLLYFIIGGNCHKYHFRRDKSFVATNTSFVATKVCLSRQKYKHGFVVTNVLSRQAYFCRDKIRVLSWENVCRNKNCTAKFSYATRSTKQSANEQFFCWCSNSSKFVTNNSNYIRCLFYNWPCCLRQLRLYQKFVL